MPELVPLQTSRVPWRNFRARGIVPFPSSAGGVVGVVITTPPNEGGTNFFLVQIFGETFNFFYK